LGMAAAMRVERAPTRALRPNAAKHTPMQAPAHHTVAHTQTHAPMLSEGRSTTNCPLCCKPPRPNGNGNTTGARNANHPANASHPARHAAPPAAALAQSCALRGSAYNIKMFRAFRGERPSGAELVAKLVRCAIPRTHCNPHGTRARLQPRWRTAAHSACL
jgi:hypothetical protein